MTQSGHNRPIASLKRRVALIKKLLKAKKK
jgi:hypothetical protein